MIFGASANWWVVRRHLHHHHLPLHHWTLPTFPAMHQLIPNLLENNPERINYISNQHLPQLIAICPPAVWCTPGVGLLTGCSPWLQCWDMEALPPHVTMGSYQHFKVLQTSQRMPYIETQLRKGAVQFQVNVLWYNFPELRKHPDSRVKNMEHLYNYKRILVSEEATCPQANTSEKSLELWGNLSFPFLVTSSHSQLETIFSPVSENLK